MKKSKKGNLNHKKMHLVSVGILASSVALSMTDSKPIIAKEKEPAEATTNDTLESVTVVSSSKEEETTDSSSTTEESTSTSTSDSTSSSESSTTSSSTSSDESTEYPSTTESTSSESTTSTNESSTNSSTTSTSTTDTTTTSTSESKISTSSSTTERTQPSKQQTQTYNTYKPKVTTSNATSSGSSNQTFYVSPNLTTKNFIKAISEDARTVAGENDVYASVMIAQAILESASGNSALAAAPNYNLFGIKGSYEGASANFLTSEDDGSGNLYTIRSDFRKYPSYKESLEDYVKLIKGGTSQNSSFYSGTWKTNTSSYKDATKYLTGRYATDSSYNSKLNGLIDAYDLTQYDTFDGSSSAKKAKKISLNTAFEHIEKSDKENDQKIEYLTHIVKKGESLKSISELYNISTLAILDKNQLDRRMLYVDQKLMIPKEQTTTTAVLKEEAVDRSLDMAQKLSNAFTGKDSNQVTKTKDYQVSASRKKTGTTYEVKKEDTLASISKKTGISVLSLKEWNDLDQYFLTEGQLLVLAPTYTLQS